MKNSITNYGSWEEAVADLESFAKNTQIPEGSCVLSQGHVINNMRKFFESHMAVVKSNMNKKTFAPYLLRLLKFKEIYTKQQEV